MTRDEFDAKYRQHKVVAEGGPSVARSYFGRSQATKTAVLVHYLAPGAKPTPQEALTRIDALGPEDRDVVLETCDVDGAVVVVTRFIWDFTTFDAWLASRGQLPTRAQPPAPAPGEFTQLFGSPAAQSPPVARGPQPPTAAPPGEFTQLFGKHAESPGSEPPPAKRAARHDLSEAPTQRIVPPAPGEFTKLFKPRPAPEPEAGPLPGGERLGAPESPSAPAPPGPAQPGPGEFTRLFGGPVPASSTGSPPSPAWQPPPSPPSEPPPGSQPVFPEPSTPADDLARRLARGPELPPVPPRVEPTPSAPKEQAPGPRAPGDFTRMFGSVDQPPQVTGAERQPGGPAQPQSAPAPQFGPGGRPSTDYLARLHGVEPAPPAGAPPASPMPPKAGGSAFTRALQRISISRAPPGEDAEPQPGRPEARSALPVVLIVCGVLVVLGLAVVLYFLLTAK